MGYSQYLRIQTRAGGLAASNRDIIRAVKSMLHRDAFTRDRKPNRFKIYRQALNHHKNQIAREF